jgi:hypothetical protein
MSLTQDRRSIPELFGDAIEQLGKLVQNEVQLARAEMSQKVAQARKGMACLAAAAILMIPAVVLLLITLALWLIQMGMSPIVSHLLAAVGAGFVGLILALVGKNYLTPERLTPTVTLDQVGRDVATAKELAK